MVENPPTVQETRVQSVGQEDPLEKGMAIHSRGQVGYSLWDHEEWDKTE